MGVESVESRSRTKGRTSTLAVEFIQCNGMQLQCTSTISSHSRNPVNQECGTRYPVAWKDLVGNMLKSRIRYCSHIAFHLQDSHNRNIISTSQGSPEAPQRCAWNKRTGGCTRSTRHDDNFRFIISWTDKKPRQKGCVC